MSIPPSSQPVISCLKEWISPSLFFIEILKMLSDPSPSFLFCLFRNFLGILSFWLKAILTLPLLEIFLRARITGRFALFLFLTFFGGFQPNLFLGSFSSSSSSSFFSTVLATVFVGGSKVETCSCSGSVSFFVSFFSTGTSSSSDRSSSVVLVELVELAYTGGSSFFITTVYLYSIF